MEGQTQANLHSWYPGTCSDLSVRLRLVLVLIWSKGCKSGKNDETTGSKWAVLTCKLNLVVLHHAAGQISLCHLFSVMNLHQPPSETRRPLRLTLSVDDTSEEQFAKIDAASSVADVSSRPSATSTAHFWTRLMSFEILFYFFLKRGKTNRSSSGPVCKSLYNFLRLNKQWQ